MRWHALVKKGNTDFSQNPCTIVWLNAQVYFDSVRFFCSVPWQGCRISWLLLTGHCLMLSDVRSKMAKFWHLCMDIFFFGSVHIGIWPTFLGSLLSAMRIIHRWWLTSKFSQPGSQWPPSVRTYFWAFAQRSPKSFLTFGTHYYDDSVKDLG